MRFLLTIPPSRTRLHQLVPLGWALRAAGHEVQVASRPEFAAAIHLTGFVAVAVDDEPGDLVSYAELWRPAVVIWDEQVPAGAAAADAAVSVRMLGPGDGTEAADGELTVDFLPPSLRTAAPASRSIRFVPYAGSSVIPAWLRRKPRRKRILLSVDTADIGAAFAAVAGLDAEVLCAADRVPPDADLPDNVRLMADLPLVAAVASCSAVVHDGSAVLACLESGLPQLAVTSDADGLAERVAAQGAGLRCAAGDLTVEHAERLLTDATLREHAERLRDELVALPSPRDFAAELVGA
jgi:UDP:flavonoid glycosyltransferase YjiC (YdhE family)